MSLTPAEAQTALKDIEKTENRAAASQHDRISAPYLILWGIIWAIGYTATAVSTQLSLVWAPLIIVGVIGSILFSRNQSAGRGGGFAWRYFASFGALSVFIGALFSIMQPSSFNQVSAFYPLIIGLYYAFVGIWSKGWRMLPLGGALIALTIVGYYFLPGYFLYWMAGVGGGGLILGGLWLRSA